MHVSRKNRQPTSVSFNMAPMIDVVFLLIIFFVLVSTFASAERIPLELPNPDHSQAQNVKLKDRVIINVQLIDPQAPATSPVAYSIGPNRPQSLGTISQRLMLLKRLNPRLKVIIRADRRVQYGDVRAAMQIVAENGIEKMSIVAHVGHGGDAS